MYRKLVTDLTDEDVCSMLNDILEITKVNNIIRDKDKNIIECHTLLPNSDVDTLIILKDYNATVPLYIENSLATVAEINQYRQFLLAKGIDGVFSQNSFHEPKFISLNDADDNTHFYVKPVLKGNRKTNEAVHLCPICGLNNVENKLEKFKKSCPVCGVNIWWD